MFFQPDEPADDNGVHSPEQQPWWSPPRDELPALFPVSELVARTPGVAILMLGARVYSNGVEFMLERRILRGDRTAREWQRDQMDFHGMYGDDPDRLRYGVALADGEKVTLEGPWNGGTEPTRSLVQMGGNGHGGEDIYQYEDNLWLWPLPPAGPLEFVVQWPAMQVPESRVELDGGAIVEVVRSVVRIWE